MDCQIVRIQENDRRLLEGLDTLHRTFFAGSSVPPEQFMEYVIERLDDEGMLLILAVQGERAVGYGLAFDVEQHPFMPEWQRAGYITQLYVDPGERRRGIGGELVAAMFEWMAARGVRQVFLNVRVDDPVAQSFWRQQEFKPHRTRMRRGI